VPSLLHYMSPLLALCDLRQCPLSRRSSEQERTYGRDRDVHYRKAMFSADLIEADQMSPVDARQARPMES